MEATSLLWHKLPNRPGSATQFQPWAALTLGVFDGLMADIKTKNDAQPDLEQAYETAEGQLHAADDDMGEMATVSLVEGRAQFNESTSEREVIDAIPTVQASGPPSQAVITGAASPAPGTVHFQYSAPGATSYDVLHRGPGQPDFVLLVADTIATDYLAMSQTVGAHAYQIVPRNSRGDGPIREIVTVTVA